MANHKFKDTAPIEEGIILLSFGAQFSLNVKNIDRFILTYSAEDGFYMTIGDKESALRQGIKTGDTMSTGVIQEFHPAKHETSGRTFNGRMTGRYKNIDKKLLDSALNEYEIALAKRNRGGYKVLPKWAAIFKVKPVTVANWLAKHRQSRND